MVNCILKVSVQEAKETCRTYQLCVGMEEGIEGVIHTIIFLWQKHSQEEYWGFLILNTQKLFNEENQMEILRAVQFDWTSGAQFAFN